MHDGRVIVEGHARRDPRATRPCTTSTSDDERASCCTPPSRWSRGRCSRSRGCSAFYGKARALDDVSFRMEPESVAIVGRNGMGKTTPVQRDHGHHAADARRARSASRATSSSAASRTGSRGAASATFRRAGASSRRSRSTSTSASRRGAPAGATEGRVDARAGLRALPAPRRAEAKRRRAALGRRAADARDRARARHEPAPARHGRAVRRARPCDHREHDRDVPATRARRASRFS